MPTETEILERAKLLHNQLHSGIDLEYEKRNTVFMFKKLAELELKIEELESRPVNLNLT